jgi:hypothetical protein
VKFTQVEVQRGERFIVWLDGVRQDYVISADEAAGCVERYVRDSVGNLVLDATSFSTKKETVRGKVRISRLHGLSNDVRSSSVVEHRAHNPVVAGPIPASATSSRHIRVSKSTD